RSCPDAAAGPCLAGGSSPLPAASPPVRAAPAGGGSSGSSSHPGSPPAATAGRTAASRRSRTALPPSPDRSARTTAAAGGCAASSPARRDGDHGPPWDSGVRSAPTGPATAPPVPSRPGTPRAASACACRRVRRRRGSVASSHRAFGQVLVVSPIRAACSEYPKTKVTRASARKLLILFLPLGFCFHSPASNAPYEPSGRPSSTAFRALSARATFLCLCKETWRKETHPASAPGAARRVRGAGGIFRRGILPLRKTPHIPVRRPAGLIRRLRRYGGAPNVKSQSQNQRQRQRQRQRRKQPVPPPPPRLQQRRPQPRHRLRQPRAPQRPF